MKKTKGPIHTSKEAVYFDNFLSSATLNKYRWFVAILKVLSHTRGTDKLIKPNKQKCVFLVNHLL